MHRSERANSYAWAALGPTGLLLLVAAVAGCHSSQPGPEDADDSGFINELIGDISATADGVEIERFEAAFAARSVPTAAQREEFARYDFRAAEYAEVSGDSATVLVEVSDREKGSSSVAGTVTWTAVKENGAWKIKDAPLPP